jgi:hypothetical protein
MNRKIKKILKRIDQKPFDLIWYRLRQLQGAKVIYESNTNLPSNVRMANVQLVQNDIIAIQKRPKKRKRLCSI